MSSHKQLPMVTLTPKQLYPIVHEIDDGSGDLSCGLQLQDLSPLWDSLCPCEVSRSDDGDDGESSQDIAVVTTKAKRHEKKDSATTVALSEIEHPFESSGFHHVQDHPLKAGKPTSQHRRTKHGRSHSHGEPYLLLDDANRERETEPHHTSPAAVSPFRKRLHIRRSSRQLIKNMFLLRSNDSIASSTREHQSVTESSMSISMSEQLHEERFHDRYILTQRVSIHKCSMHWLELEQTLTAVPCQVFQGEYQVFECIERESGMRYCTKIASKENILEAELMQALVHPCIAPLVDFFVEKEKLYLVMEWQLNLFSRVLQDGPMSEEAAQEITFSLLQGCRFLHEKSIVHADLHPENILLSRDSNFPACRITNFSSAINLEVHKPCGGATHQFMAPEVVQAKKTFDTQADMWSIGCIVHFMLTASCPFDDERIASCPTATLPKSWELTFPDHHFKSVSRSPKQFIAGLLITDPSVRMTCEEALEHPWMRLATKPPPSVTRRSTSKDIAFADLEAVRQSNEPCSPAQKGSKKHHRRMSSISKALTKLLFSPKDQNASKDAHQPPQIGSVNSWDCACSEKKTGKKKHRRFVTG